MPIILTWITLAVVLPLVAPSLEDVGTSDQRDFLPADAPFADAENLYKELFPKHFSPSSGLVIIDASETGGVAEGTPAWEFLGRATTWLTSDDAPAGVIDVASPTLDPTMAERLIDPGGEYAVVAFGLDAPTVEQRSRDAVEAIDDWLDDNTPDSLPVYHTGEAKIDIEADDAMLETIDKTLIITIVLVIVFLLAIYRSPVSPLIPLFAVTMALFVTVGVLGILGDLGVFTIITQTNPLLIVVMYGAGTDYCLFLISRFREEMADTDRVEVATQDTVHMVGETITSSASTIFVGFMAMAFSEMGFFKNSGPMLAVGIVIGLLAGLTLTPSLLSLLGERAFWPSKAKHRSHGKWYDFTSRQASSRPLTTILLIVAIMLPFSAYGLSQDVTYEFLNDYPDDMESIEGYDLLEEHFGQGVVFPLTVVVADPAPDALAEEIARLGRDLVALEGVADVFSLNNSLGMEDETYRDVLRVETQLQMAQGMVLGGLEEADSEQAAALIAGWDDYLDRLAARFDGLNANPDYERLRSLLAGGAEDVTARQDEIAAATAGLVAHFSEREDAYLMPGEGGALFASLEPLVTSYIASNGVSFQVSVLLANEPGHETSIETVQDIRDLLENRYGDGQAGVSGLAAVVTDIRETIDRDLIRAFGFVLAGIFLVLLVMLRSAIAPLYLIGTVLISYTFTLGITNIVFDVFFDTPQLSWAVEFFMFVFLVALGIDYSIFLFGRIKEEVAYHGVREGVHTAVATTGAIITSAGLILAGTFAGLMAGEIKFLSQVGFAVAFGVLVDTFIVRTILDPALAALFGRWTWWPGGIPRAPRARPGVPAPASGD